MEAECLRSGKWNTPKVKTVLEGGKYLPKTEAGTKKLLPSMPQPDSLADEQMGKKSDEKSLAMIPI